jgi:hypothetical protein
LEEKPGAALFKLKVKNQISKPHLKNKKCLSFP